MEDPPGPSDPILRSRRYVLGEEEESFAIWDLQSPGEPIERFPATPEGFEEAEARYKELRRVHHRGRRADRWARIEARIPRLLIAGILVGAALWIVGGIVIHAPGIVPFFDVSILLADIGYRLLATSVALALGIAITRWAGSSGAEGRGWIRSVPPSRPETALVWAIVGGVAVWLVAGVVATWFPWSPYDTSFPPGPDGFAFVEEESSSVGRVASFVDSLAFRVWVAAAVLLALRWTWRWRTAEPSGSTEGP